MAAEGQGLARHENAAMRQLASERLSTANQNQTMFEVVKAGSQSASIVRPVMPRTLWSEAPPI